MTLRERPLTPREQHLREKEKRAEEIAGWWKPVEETTVRMSERNPSEQFIPHDDAVRNLVLNFAWRKRIVKLPWCGITIALPWKYRRRTITLEEFGEMERRAAEDMNRTLEHLFDNGFRPGVHDEIIYDPS